MFPEDVNITETVKTEFSKGKVKTIKQNVGFYEI